MKTIQILKNPPYYLKGLYRRILMSHIFGNTKQYSFDIIQIGSNRGNDLLTNFIYDYGLECIFVEPVKKAIEDLKIVYNENKNHKFENICIYDKDGATIFFVDKDLDNRSSLSPINIGTTNKKKFVRILANCLTLNSLFKKYKIKKLTMLFVDCEGYDYYIIEQLLKTKVRPLMIQYENNMMGNKNKYLKETLRTYDYRCIDIGKDTFCYL